ncbi:VOC family protein [Lysobacter sp. 5GHs7-4]|uniref:ArsI/CadI family heavy metal resistance metalloenzyme n=1 Tax=Lysobacter sp. 5GHs7-4 TaxID=2904253 RepID=UPI001E5D08DF|nr:ArsI/CadI family heavy metal resistance metalloenzyme [Lysobacter sp. 5GHs7-4]UHQ22264.1 VOC family protein [Lysobacter sp. 5GHs7-4]
MNRFHVHLNVADLSASIRFYNELFAMPPTVQKADYAKWMLDDPRINFAISHTGRAPGIDHLGLQVDSGDELSALGQRLDAAGGTVVPEEAAVCCYAQADKLWTADPQGTRWETFHTFGEATTYYDPDVGCAGEGAAACAPSPPIAAKPVAAGCCATSASCG